MNNYSFVFTFGSILLAAIGLILFVLTMGIPPSAMDCILYLMSWAILFGVWTIDSKTKDPE